MENNKITGNEPATACKSTADSGTLLGEVDIHHTGLTIRQQFAMAAMQSQIGLLAHEYFRRGIELTSESSSKTSEEVIARLSIIQADALIAELNK